MNGKNGEKKRLLKDSKNRYSAVCHKPHNAQFSGRLMEQSWNKPARGCKGTETGVLVPLPAAQRPLIGHQSILKLNPAETLWQRFKMTVQRYSPSKLIDLECFYTKVLANISRCMCKADRDILQNTSSCNLSEGIDQQRLNVTLFHIFNSEK